MANAFFAAYAITPTHTHSVRGYTYSLVVSRFVHLRGKQIARAATNWVSLWCPICRVQVCGSAWARVCTVYVYMWLLAFGTVCEMIFHLAFLAICFSSLEQPAKPPASNFFYQSQLIMQVLSMGECVCWCMCVLGLLAFKWSTGWHFFLLN